jgi:hypothetical protein
LDFMMLHLLAVSWVLCLKARFASQCYDVSMAVMTWVGSSL